jgi:uncharacterized membrane protein
MQLMSSQSRLWLALSCLICGFISATAALTIAVIYMVTDYTSSSTRNNIVLGLGISVVPVGICLITRLTCMYLREDKLMAAYEQAEFSVDPGL